MFCDNNWGWARAGWLHPQKQKEFRRPASRCDHSCWASWVPLLFYWLLTPGVRGGLFLETLSSTEGQKSQLRNWSGSPALLRGWCCFGDQCWNEHSGAKGANGRWQQPQQRPSGDSLLFCWFLPHEVRGGWCLKTLSSTGGQVGGTELTAQDLEQFQHCQGSPRVQQMTSVHAGDTYQERDHWRLVRNWGFHVALSECCTHGPGMEMGVVPGGSGQESVEVGRLLRGSPLEGSYGATLCIQTEDELELGAPSVERCL
ncbi:uncharacterized protein ACIGJ3_021861 [Trichechus inunguis]